MTDPTEPSDVEDAADEATNAEVADGTDLPDQDASTQPADIDHDATGLELARRIASAIGRSTPAGVRKKSGRPRPPRSTTPSRSDDRDPKLLGPALEHLVNDRGWSTEVSVHTLLGRWPALVGQVNADHAQPESYQDGVLVVRAESTAWATSLRTLAPQLVARLNEELGQGTVTAIKVLGPVAPSWRHGRRSVRGRGPRDTYG